MPIDSSIYLQQQTPDIFGSISNGIDQGMTLGSAIKQKQMEMAQKDLYAPDPVTGRIGLNQAKLGEFASRFPQQAYQVQTENDKAQNALAAQKIAQQKSQAELHKEQFDLSAPIVHGTTPETWDTDRKKLLALGADDHELPQTYDPAAIKALQGHFYTAQQQIDMKNSDRTFKQRQEELGTKHEENAIKRDQLTGDKTDKLAKAMTADLDADKGRAGNFGQISAKVQSADRLKTLASAYSDGNMPAAQMEEFALGLSNMLAPGGGGSRGQVEALVPHSAIGDANKLKSWLMNEPAGAGQQAFVKNMSDTIERERSTATDQLNGIRASRLAAHDRLRKAAPDQYNAILQSYGMDPANIKNGRYIQPPKPGTVPAFHEMDDASLDAAYKAAGGK